MARVSGHFTPIPTHHVEGARHHIAVSGDLYPPTPAGQVAKHNVERHPIDESWNTALCHVATRGTSHAAARR
jgi:hypothetical protein